MLRSAASFPREEATRIDLPEWFLEELTLLTPQKHEFEKHVVALRKVFPNVFTRVKTVMFLSAANIQHPPRVAHETSAL